MNLRNRPARDVEAPREWSLDRRETQRIASIHARQAADLRAKMRVLVRDGKPVEDGERVSNDTEAEEPEEGC